MKIGEKLIECGMINQEQLQLALDRHARTGRRLGETAMELGFVPERDFLGFLADVFDTRFVTSTQLLAFPIRTEVLKLLPAKFAKLHQMVPVTTGNQSGYLGLVTSEPQNLGGVEEARILSGYQDVRVYVSTHQAVEKLIQMHYFDDAQEEVLVEVEIPVEPQVEVAEPEPADDQTEMVVAQAKNEPVTPQKDLASIARVFVGMMEKNNQVLPGHSLRVARTVELVSRKMNCSEPETRNHILAAYLHEIGKNLTPHLTLIAIEKQGDNELLARKTAGLPSSNLSGLDIPEQVHEILNHLYDRYDPTAETPSPLGSRIIAAVDAFEDLVGNPENSLGRLWAPEAALAWLTKRFAFLFDHGVLEALGQIIKEQVAKKLAPTKNLPILLADPETANCYLLESALRKAGLQVIIASDSQQAMSRFIENELAAVVIDAALEPDNGFALLDFINRTGRQVPTIMMAANSQPETITRAFKEGVSDFIGKPVGPDELISKLARALKQEESPVAQLACSVSKLA